MFDQQSATSRANAAKSKGPKTADGRQKSSQNALKHGFTAVSTILIQCEDPDEHLDLLADYNETYQPATRPDGTAEMPLRPAKLALKFAKKTQAIGSFPSGKDHVLTSSS